MVAMPVRMVAVTMVLAVLKLKMVQSLMGSASETSAKRIATWYKVADETGGHGACLIVAITQHPSADQM